MRTKLMVALLLLVPLVASAAVDTLWSRRWTGAGRHDDAITQIATDAAGFVYAAGIGWDSVTNNYAMVTAKYDSWGGLKWRSTYNAYPFADTFAAILLDAVGDVYVAGTVRYPARGKQIRTVKYNGTTGAQTWTMGYDAQADTSEDQFVMMSYGGADTARLFICGTSYMGASRKYDYSIVRYNPATGAQVWSFNYNWPMAGRFGEDVATGMCIGLNGDPVVTGYSYDDNDAVSDWQTMKFSRFTGDTAAGWSAFGKGRVRRDLGNDEEWPFSVAAADNGNLFVTGMAYNNPLGYYMFQLIKHNGVTGDTIRLKRSLAGDDEHWGKVVKYRDGYVYTASHYYDAADEQELSAEDWGVECWDTSRLVGSQWNNFVDGGYLGWDECWDMTFDPQGRPYVTGFIEDTITGYMTWRTIRYDPATGLRDLDLRYLPRSGLDTFDNCANSIAIRDTNHIYVGGYINRWNQAGGGWDQDMSLVRYGGLAASVALDSLVPVTDTLDSGATTTYTAWYHNNGYSDLPNKPMFNLTIGTLYTASVTDTVGTLPGQRGCVTFPVWTALERGALTLKCTMLLEGDTSFGNNKIERPVFVRVHDVGPLAFVNLPDTLGGGPYTPSATVTNYGNVTETFSAEYTLGTGTATATVTDLAPGATATVVFSPAITPGLGDQTATAYTQLGPDVNRHNDTITRGVFVALLDLSATRIIAPAGSYSENDPVTPSGYIKNVGNVTAACQAIMTFGSYVESTAVNLAAGESALATFPVWTATPVGAYTAKLYANLADNNAANDTARSSFLVGGSDVAATAIVAPVDTVNAGTVVAQARLENLGSASETFSAFFMIDGSITGTLTVTLAGGGDSVVSFAGTSVAAGAHATRCSVYLAGDLNPANDVASGSFYAKLTKIPGWHRWADVPLGAKSKRVKDGGSLVWNTENLVYAFKGNGRYEFYAYNIAGNTWATMESIPAIGSAGRKKAVKKGGTLTRVEDKIYATKGNSTYEFWRYTPGTDAGVWTELAAVPMGVKAIREGTGTAPVKLGGTDYIYLLKGSNTTEFYRYDVPGNAWTAMASPPLGTSGKNFKNGSTITYDANRNLIYAVKASYNEFYAYNVDSNTWTTLTPVPFIGSMGKKKKLKDGAGLVALDNYVWCLKGGNTQEYWRYSADSGAGTWQQFEDMPIGGGRRVKGGGCLTRGDGEIWALKGNNTMEFYQYVPAPTVLLKPVVTAPSAAMGGATTGMKLALAVAPNPFSGATNVAWSLPRGGDYRLRVYDVAGNLVQTLGSGMAPAGSYTARVNAERLARGIYLLRLEADGGTLTQKLVIE